MSFGPKSIYLLRSFVVVVCLFCFVLLLLRAAPRKYQLDEEVVKK